MTAPHLISPSARKDAQTPLLLTPEEVDGTPEIHLRGWHGKYPLVSVAIVNWNYSRYVGAAIDFVKRQDYPHFECVVVDNGSTDNSVAVITKAIGDDARFRLFQLPENLGQLGAFLEVFRTLNGRFINFLDADDVLFDNFLSSHIQVHLATNTPASFTSNYVVTIGADDEIISGHHYVLDDEDRRKFLKCLPQVRELSLPPVSDSDYEFLRAVTFHAPASHGRWCWSAGSANVIRREMLSVLAPDPSQAPFFGGPDSFLIPLFAVTGANIIGTPLSAYRIHGANDHSRLPQLRGIRSGNEEAYLRNSAAKRLLLIVIIERAERILEIISPPARYFRLLEMMGNHSVDLLFVELVFVAADVKRALAKKYPLLVEVFGERTVIRELRSLMEFKHVAEIVSMACHKRLPFAKLHLLSRAGIRK